MDYSPPDSAVHGIFKSGDIPDAWIEPPSPALQSDFLPMSHLEAFALSLPCAFMQITLSIREMDIWRGKK